MRAVWWVWLVGCGGPVVDDTHTGGDTGDTDVADEGPIVDDHFETEEGGSMVLDVLANDADGVEVTGYDASTSLATVAFRGDKKFSWNARGGFGYLSAGETADDVFTYTARAPDGETATATVTITVSGVNSVPVVNDELLATNEDTPLIIRVLDNDRDPDAGDVLTITNLDTTDTIATITLNGDQTITYDPTVAFDYLSTGERVDETFSYTVSDGHGGEGEGEVRVTVVGRPD